jgi:protein TonB
MYPVGDPPTTGEIVPGRVVYRADPRYPKEAKNERIHGTVELIATIDQSGNVSAIAISSGDLTLAEAAVDAVRSWKFEPYTQNGRPVEA